MDSTITCTSTRMGICMLRAVMGACTGRRRSSWERISVPARRGNVRSSRRVRRRSWRPRSWSTARKAREFGSRLCYSGGVAQNVIANAKVAALFDHVWIVPDPTDGGSSLGAAAWAYAEQSGKNRIHWIDVFLGHDIKRQMNPREVVDYLLDKRVCGVANVERGLDHGRWATGHWSVSTASDIKDTVNAIKRREPFRPFGPAILEEEFDKWFEGPSNEYMQFVQAET